MPKIEKFNCQKCWFKMQKFVFEMDAIVKSNSQEIDPWCMVGPKTSFDKPSFCQNNLSCKNTKEMLQSMKRDYP